MDFLFEPKDENNTIERSKEEIKRKANELIQKLINDEEPSTKKSKLDEKILRNPMETTEVKRLTTEGCIHEVAYPKHQTFKRLKPLLEEPVFKFPFTLDSFQKHAIQCIENDQSVLVSAHTSAGKTVCAQYAIALCMKENKRVIYTTPIKALSNQKYRDFKETFKDVGLMTGDVTINEHASIVIMTTEILRSMIYNNNSILKEIGWLVFDEIHYMANEARGYIWEEVLIQVPHQHRMLFLSATIPNASDFARWIAYTHKKPCHIVYTEYRPTPLKHFLYPNTSEVIYQIIDDNNKFNEHNFDQAIKILCKAGESAKFEKKFKSYKIEKVFIGHVHKLVKKMKETEKFPMIIFSFSKNDCEVYAKQLNMCNFNTKKEVDSIELIYQCAIATLPRENEDEDLSPDHNLPELTSMLELVKRGIGIHHSGLLPIAKELVEILFGEGLIKVLFATDTFAMGLNMPAKTVVFSTIQKFNGKTIEALRGSEYTQMAGRAGRRGIDKFGDVILMLDTTVSRDLVRDLLSGQSEPLNSKFKLTFGTILSLAKGCSKSIKAFDLVKKSFLQFQKYAELPVQNKELEELKLELNKMKGFSRSEMKQLENLAETVKELRNLREEKWASVRNKEILRPFLKPGRVIHVKINDVDFGWAIVISNSIRTNRNISNLDILMLISSESDKLLDKDIKKFKPPTETDPKIIDDDGNDEDQYILRGKPYVTNISLNMVFEVSSVTISAMNKVVDLIKSEVKIQIEMIKKLKTILQKPIELLHLKTNLNVNKQKIGDYYEKIEKLERFVLNHKFTNRIKEVSNQKNCENFDLNIIPYIYNKNNYLNDKITKLEYDIEYTKDCISLMSIKTRFRILNQLNYLNENNDAIDGLLTVKGRVATELSTAGCTKRDCKLGLEVLLMTELLMKGFFNHMPLDLMVGLLTCFVFDEGIYESSTISKDAKEKLVVIKQEAECIVKQAKEVGLINNEEKNFFISILNYDIRLIEPVRGWALGCSFSRISKLTDVAEGSLVRCVRRVNELLVSLKESAIIMKNKELETMFHKASLLIRRGIIFASSLYLVDPNEEN